MAHIRLKNVSIDFPIYGIRTRSLKSQLIRASTGGRFNNDTEHHIVNIRALDDISLSIEHGDRVGLIGHNGAGKSTFLRVLSSIYPPTQGVVDVKGNVSALLDIMLGMEPEATGYDNIILRGILQGLNFQQIREKQEEIAAFTELGDYLSMPIRTYSTGMQLRLAFAIATSITPEILILDEIINTGDEAFIKKAEERIKQVISSAHIVVVASHDLSILEDLCNKLLWLDQGAIRHFGDVKTTLELYKTT